MSTRRDLRTLEILATTAIVLESVIIILMIAICACVARSTKKDTVVPDNPDRPSAETVHTIENLINQPTPDLLRYFPETEKRNNE